MFDLNLGLSFWTTLVFISLLSILWKFAWGPILGAVQAREDGIQETLDQAANERKEAAKLLTEHREQMADVRRQAQQIIAEGKEAGERVRQDIEEKARAEGDSMIERARESIDREKDAALEELRKESVELALAAAAKLVQESLDEEKDRELVMSFIDELSGGDEVQA
ncbi:MAG: F0F1 ATP synthase subunit B [Gemmatimonadota bacterium]|uniref:ATP synthase F0 subunit B n=1 Tax=marine metagenome TaxID=408172 RepID=A0A382CPS5_9ZZZZ|nr:F0F1 ATP synthase subunit B [Gemmatimonadota bacterium]